MRRNEKPLPPYIGPFWQPVWDLPNLSAPSPKPDHPTNAVVGLVILFTDAYRKNTNLLAWVRAAIYSRDSTLKATDAVKRGVAIKLYIEDVLRPLLTPTLEENFIDTNEDVIWFTPPTLEGVWGYLGKQMCPYWDEQLLIYDRIIVWDADTFFLPENKVSMFAHSAFLPAEYIYYINLASLRFSAYKDAFLFKFNQITERGDIPVDALLKNAGVDLNTFPDTIIKPSGHLWSYAPAHFHKHHSDFVDWMRNHAPYLGSDELTTVCWQQLFDIPLGELHFLLRLRTHHTPSFLLEPNTHANLLHGLFPAGETIEAEFRKHLWIR